jgi:hypothetical protein
MRGRRSPFPSRSATLGRRPWRSTSGLLTRPGGGHLERNEADRAGARPRAGGLPKRMSGGVEVAHLVRAGARPQPFAVSQPESPAHALRCSKAGYRRLRPPSQADTPRFPQRSISTTLDGRPLVAGMHAPRPKQVSIVARQETPNSPNPGLLISAQDEARGTWFHAHPEGSAGAGAAGRPPVPPRSERLSAGLGTTAFAVRPARAGLSLRRQREVRDGRGRTIGTATEGSASADRC